MQVLDSIQFSKDTDTTTTTFFYWISRRYIVGHHTAKIKTKAISNRHSRSNLVTQTSGGFQLNSPLEIYSGARMGLLQIWKSSLSHHQAFVDTLVTFRVEELISSKPFSSKIREQQKKHRNRESYHVQYLGCLFAQHFFYFWRRNTFLTRSPLFRFCCFVVAKKCF